MPACRHPDIQKFDEIRCCLSCGEAVFVNNAGSDQASDNLDTPTYKYRPLNYELGQEIRLVVLKSGQQYDEIMCNIIHTNLLDEPVYEAVSYTWATTKGEASLDRYISCRGKKIYITQNCQSVLRYLRLPYRDRSLWIDAVCIDQKNTSERSHQVQLMATVYSNASQVLAYVGPSHHSNESAVIRIMDQLKHSRLNFNYSKDRDDLQIFLDQPYFDRIWVLQEIALAKIVTLICGDKSIRWTADTVSSLLFLCSFSGISPPSVLQWLPASQPEKGDLIDVLHRSRNCSATDPKDKVYGLLGLVQRDVANSISVDYSRTSKEVYNELAIYLLKEQGRFDVLLHTVDQWVQIDLAPTWVPEWDYKCVYKLLPPQFSPSEIEKLATSWFSQPLRDQNSKLDDTSILTDNHRRQQHEDYASTEFRFEICSRAVFPIPPPISSLPCLRIRAHLLDTIVKLHMTYTEKKRHTLSRDLPVAFGDRNLCSACRKIDIDVCPKAPMASPHPPAVNQYDVFKATLKQLGMGMRMFSTKQSFGFAQDWGLDKSLRVGDTIWHLAGLSKPVFLRRCKGYYTMIGECYLFRATVPHPCANCGCDSQPWSMVTEVIDIW